MPKVYIEHDDGHNEAHILTFESEDDAIKHISAHDEDYSTDAGLAPGEDIRNVLFNVAHPDHCGQFDGLDRWSVMDFDEARSRSDYWARVADRIANDQEAE